MTALQRFPGSGAAALFDLLILVGAFRGVAGVVELLALVPELAPVLALLAWVAGSALAAAALVHVLHRGRS